MSRPVSITALLVWLLCAGTAVGQATSNQAGSYRLLQGTIDKYPVTIHLYGYKGQWIGNYSYDRVGHPIDFMGIDTLKDGTVNVEVYKGESSESFQLRPSENGLEGLWRKDAKSPPLPVSLKETKPVVPLRVIHRSDRVAHRPALSESPGCSFEATAVWPLGDSPADAFVKRQVIASLDEKAAANTNPEGLLNGMSKGYIDACLKEAKGAKEEEVREMPSAYTRDIVHAVTVKSQTAEFLSLQDMEWEYSGGAHGNGYSMYRILDLKNLKRLGMGDIFTAQGQKTLPGLIEKRFRMQYGLKSGQSLRDAGLYENRIAKATPNVYMTAKGVVFCYTSYEIGPYAMGPVEVFVPFTELKPNLQPGFAKRVGA